MNSLPKRAKTKAEVWNEYKVVITECEEILTVLGDMHLPETKPRVLELTDAGPGVGCSYGAVQYRMAETILVHVLDKVVRVQREEEKVAKTRQNVPMRPLVTHSFLARLYNGNIINFEGMSSEEINALSPS